MKIRMTIISLRLRLMQREVITFQRQGKVKSTTSLGPLPENHISFIVLKYKP